MKFKLYYFLIIAITINIVSTIFIGVLGEDVPHISMIRVTIFTGIFAVYFSKYYKNELIHNFTAIYVLYMLFLVLISSDPMRSLDLTMRFVFSLLFLPIAYRLVNNNYKYQQLLTFYFYSLISILLFLVYANYFQIGESVYAAGTIYFGLNENITKPMAILLIVSPLLLLKSPINRIFVIIVLIAVLIIVMIGLKRGAFLTILAAFCIYMIYTNRKRFVLASAFVTFLALIMAYPLYQDVLSERLDRRQERIKGLATGETAIETEMRYLETRMVQNAFLEGNLKHKLIGSEIFNDRLYFRVDRMLHVDYNIILNGKGLLGLLLYFGLYFVIYLKFRRVARNVNDVYIVRFVIPVFMAMLIAPLVMGISGTVYNITIRSLVMIFLGGTLGFIEREGKKQKQQ